MQVWLKPQKFTSFAFHFVKSALRITTTSKTDSWKHNLQFSSSRSFWTTVSWSVVLYQFHFSPTLHCLVILQITSNNSASQEPSTGGYYRGQRFDPVHRTSNRTHFLCVLVKLKRLIILMFSKQGLSLFSSTKHIDVSAFKAIFVFSVLVSTFFQLQQIILRKTAIETAILPNGTISSVLYRRDYDKLQALSFKRNS